MLALQPPPTNSVLDEIYNSFEQLILEQLSKSREKAKQNFPEFKDTNTKKQRDFAKQFTINQFKDICKDIVIRPIDNILAQFSCHFEGYKEDNKRKQPQLPYQNRETSDCPKLTGKDRPNNDIDVKIANVKAQMKEGSSLEFDRYQQFLNFKGRSDNIQKLKLDLQSQSLGDNGMDWLSVQLRRFLYSEQLSINLSNNGIGKLGAKKFGDAFFDLKSLRYLSLNMLNNKIKVQGVQSLFQHIHNIPHLLEFRIDLGCNAIGNTGIDEIGKKVLQMRNLNKIWLDVYDNQIYEEGMNLFLVSFQSWPVFRTLHLDFRVNPVSKKNKEAISTFVRHKKLIDYEILF